jgi:uncharacterized protein (DUF1330 family)
MGVKPATFASRIDKEAVRDLKSQSLPVPIDALNLVDLAGDTSYRWYGLLLSPLVLALGGRPVWVGVHQRSLIGEKQADEIVIVRYPSHRTLLNIMDSPYYRLVNRFREKGVRHFQFSITHRHAGEKKMKRSGLRLVAHFNGKTVSGEEIFTEVKSILERGPGQLLYASREVAPLDIFHSLEPTDPNPAKYKETAIFSIDDIETVVAHLDDTARNALGAATGGVSLQVYRGLGTMGAILGQK